MLLSAALSWTPMNRHQLQPGTRGARSEVRFRRSDALVWPRAPLRGAELLLVRDRAVLSNRIAPM
jgi:hypothetical protein